MSVGLRHLTEDLIKIVRGETFESDRYLYVLTEWIDIFQRAYAASQTVNGTRCCIHTPHRRLYVSLERVWGNRTLPRIETLRSFLLARQEAWVRRDASIPIPDPAHDDVIRGLEALVIAEWSDD